MGKTEVVDNFEEALADFLDRNRSEACANCELAPMDDWCLECKHYNTKKPRDPNHRGG